MAGTLHGRSFRLSPIDGRGRRIDPVVLDVAQEIAARAIRHAEKLLRDPALATSLLEESAAAVSRVIRAKNQTGNAPVRKLHAYLFRAFIRRVNRTKRKHPAFVELTRANPSAHPRWASLSEEFELKMLIDEFLTSCDDVTRDLYANGPDLTECA